MTGKRATPFLDDRCRVLMLAILLTSIAFVGSCTRQQSAADADESDQPKSEVAANLQAALNTGLPLSVGHRRRSRVTEPPAFAEDTLTASAAAASCTPLKSDTIYRFIDGHDACPVELTQAEIAAELNDPWATSVLRKGSFPSSVAAIVKAINAANPTFQQNSYMVGEGSQISPNVVDDNGKPIGRDGNRDLRYAITWNPAQNSVQILLSAAPGGNSGFLQVISWDSKKDRFNFYDYGNAGVGGALTWSWTGDSSWAGNPQTIGQGCFDCHHNGVVIMKEFDKPWNNWNSSLALIQPSFVPQAVASEALFQNLQNAPALQSAVQGAVQNYYNRWLRGLIDQGTLENVPEVLRHLIVNTTVQFESSLIKSDPAKTSPANAPITGLPSNFFLWDTVLRDVLQLSYRFPNSLKLDRTAYDNYLKSNGFALVNITEDGGPAYKQGGSTDAAFFVPVPPQEDLFMIQLMIQAKAVSPKFAASVLMVDFQNPVFSPTRQSLQQYAEKIQTGKLDAQDIPSQFAAEVTAAAADQPTCNPLQLDACTAEQQFLHYWNLTGTQWKTDAEGRITNYMTGISQQVSSGAALDAYMSLGVSRRHQFATIPVISNLCEMSLLLPRTNIPVPVKPLRMTTDGTVVPGQSPPTITPASCLD